MRKSGFIAPMIPTLIEEPPSSAAWVHEIKHDGYRTVLAIDGVGIRAFTRRGSDWSDRYSAVVEAARKLRCKTAVIDGEMVVQGETGVADFNALQNALEGDRNNIIFIAFDLMQLDGEDLRMLPLIERKQALRKIMPRGKASRILYGEHVEGDGREVFKAAAAMGLEGIVSKLADSRYRSGPTKSWLKTKAMVEEDMIVLGTEMGKHGIPTALLARRDGGGLAYAGKAMIAMSRVERDALHERLQRIWREKPAPVSALPKAKAEWVKPEVHVRVRHLKGAEKLRHASVRGLSGRRGQ